MKTLNLTHIVRRTRIAKLNAILPPLLIVLAFFVLWEILARLFSVPDWLLPVPSQVATQLVGEADLLFGASLVTLGEILLGFVIAVALGVLFAVLIAWTNWLERGLYPLVIGLQTLPILAIAPLLIVWFGLGIASKVVIVVLISFFPIVVSLVDGLKSTDRDLANMMRVLGASQMQIFVKLRVPLALPALFAGLKLAVVGAVVGAVVAEWLGASSGLGYLIKVQGTQFNTDTVFAAIFVLVLMAGALFLAVRLLQNWFLRNHKPKESN